MTPSMRRRLQEAREQRDDAQQALEDAIVAAYEAGGGMREIADEVGMTHPGVSKLLERVGARRRDMTAEELRADLERRGQAW